MGYGQDPKLVYRRDTKLVDVTCWKWDWRIVELLNCEPESHYFFTPIAALGFCGKIYPVWLKGQSKMTAEALMNSSDNSAELGLNGLIEQAQQQAVRAYGFSRASKEFRSVAEDARYHFNLSEEFEGHPIETAIFRDLDCPVFVARKHSEMYVRKREEFQGLVFTNPRLATLGFNKKMDAFTAFQEIAMFLGSTLASEPIAPSTVGDDELIARSKGFDEQSFRTAAPGQKKLNRKLNKQAKRQKRDE